MKQTNKCYKEEKRSYSKLQEFNSFTSKFQLENAFSQNKLGTSDGAIPTQDNSRAQQKDF